jgi:hypothetical protein
MTTRATAEALLFDEPETLGPIGLTVSANRRERAEPIDPDQLLPTGSKRCRLKPIYCPSCQGWVEVLLQPVRLRCTGCGLEARP